MISCIDDARRNPLHIPLRRATSPRRDISPAVIRSAAAAVYSAVVSARRRWYCEGQRQRHLERPVISVGNLAVGGSGKTPFVEYLARLLAADGEHPAILSRGYGRRANPAGVTVVSDGVVRADLDHAGDEPLMLARALPGVPVLVGPARYLAGRLAEQRFGATVHLLDDGFQHVTLARDVDLVLLSESDFDDRVLPAGRLREPLSTAARADAVILSGPQPDVLERSRRLIHGPAHFTSVRALTRVAWVSSGETVGPSELTAVFAVAGIARPQRFFDDLTAAGHGVSGTMAFADHHRFTSADVARVANAARRVQASVVVTTSKDLVRLEAVDCRALPLAVAHISTNVAPHNPFAEWLRSRLASARASRMADAPSRALVRAQ